MSKIKNEYQKALEWISSQKGWIDPYEFSEEHQDMFEQLLIEKLERESLEREDEKAYCIKISDDVLKFVNTNGIYVGFNYIALATSTVTQTQIDNFPAEIKGAIECGFLRKVEVE